MTSITAFILLLLAAFVRGYTGFGFAVIAVVGLDMFMDPVQSDIPIIITSGSASFIPETVMDHAAPRYIDFVARDFPELKIVMSHAGYPWVNEAVTVAQRNKNVYLEMSEYEEWPQGDIYVQAANSIIGDKLLFASANPFVNLNEQLERYSKLAFNKDVYENVMYHNGAKVLGL